ncbi:hypothetical protein PIB30_058493 [Stylosanthes scabra]|uniref:Uncharacterized protein n=1 Tax=Stylosanthes scabra TaxID=79078 RepID=A0ABU6SKY1_9FABA|nr:hypothetical protein [Stylosanthes scabra]
MSLFKNVHQGLSRQVMEETYSYDQRYTPWNPPPYQHHVPPPPYTPSEGNFEDILQVLRQERNEIRKAQGKIEIQLDLIIKLATLVIGQGREDTLLNEEDVESLHESLEEVEEGNEAQVAEDVDRKVDDNDKEPKGM